MTNPTFSPDMFTYAIQSSFAKNRQLERVAENLLHYLLKTEVNGKPLGGCLAAAVLGIGTWDAAEIDTQTSQGTERPDMTIRLKAQGDEVGRLVMELKIDADFGDQQIERYLDLLASVSSPKALMIVARYKETLSVAQNTANNWKQTNDAHVRFLCQDWAALVKRLQRFRLSDQQKSDLRALLVFAERAGTVPLPLKARTADSLLSPVTATSFLEHLTFADQLARRGQSGGLKIYGNWKWFTLHKGTTSNYGVLFEPHRDDPSGSPTDFYCMQDARQVVLVTNQGFHALTSPNDQRLRGSIRTDWNGDAEVKARKYLNEKLERIRQSSLQSPGHPPDSFYDAGGILWEIMEQSLRILCGKKAKGQIDDNVSERLGFQTGSRGIVIRAQSWAASPKQGPLRVLQDGSWNSIPPKPGEVSEMYVSRVLAELIEPPT